MIVHPISFYYIIFVRWIMNSFASVARDVANKLNARTAAADRDVEWQRVNSLIADVLKDAHVLYAKLARLQGDFAGKELDELEKVSEGVLAIGGKLSSFSKQFYEGGVSMTTEDLYGAEEGPLFGGSEGSAEPMVLDVTTESSGSADPMAGPPPESPVVKSDGSADSDVDVDVEFDYSAGGSEESDEDSSEGSASE